MYSQGFTRIDHSESPVNGEPEAVVDDTPIVEDSLKEAAVEAVMDAKYAIYNAQAAIARAIAEGELPANQCYTLHFGSAQVDLERIEAEMSGEAAVERKNGKASVSKFLEMLTSTANGG